MSVKMIDLRIDSNILCNVSRGQFIGIQLMCDETSKTNYVQFLILFIFCFFFCFQCLMKCMITKLGLVIIYTFIHSLKRLLCDSLKTK